MNQPPEQIALFGENSRDRVGPSRAPEPAQEQPKSFDPHSGQLAMFMTPREIQKHYVPLEADRTYQNGSSFGRLETNDEMWARKKKEAGERGLAGSIRRHGVISPVQLGLKDQESPDSTPQVFGGHHRIAAAPPDSLIPVLHYGIFRKAREDTHNPYERPAGVDKWKEPGPKPPRPSTGEIADLLKPVGY